MESNAEQTWLRYGRDFEAFLKLEKGMPENSVVAYMQDLHHMSDFMIEQSIVPEDVELHHLQQLIKFVGELGVAATSQRRMIAGWRQFFRMLVIEDAISDNPADMLDLPMRPNLLPDVLTDDEISQIQSTFDLSLPEPARNYVIVELLYGCGLRVSELVNLRMSNIYADEQYLQIIGKGDKERWVPVNDRALKLLDNYIHNIRSHIAAKPGEEKIVFLNRRGSRLTRQMIFIMLKDAVRQAGIQKKVSPHSLRHSFATELVAGGADLRAVQEMLGHESISTTEIYTHISRDTLRNTIATYHPHYKKK